MVAGSGLACRLPCTSSSARPGHIGSELTKLLLGKREPVTVVARSREKAADLAARGAEIAVFDVHGVAALHDVFARARRAFVLNPPTPPSTDTVKEERETVRCIAAALEGTPRDHCCRIDVRRAARGGFW